MQMFADQKDRLRNHYNIRSNNGIEKSLKKSHPILMIPMPAVGEVFCKLRDKCKNSQAAILEMNRLFNDKIVSPAYLSEGEELFAIAKEISKVRNDDRDQISPMDALIAAAATVDKKCVYLYTTDNMLISNITILDTIKEWRSERNYPLLKPTDPALQTFAQRRPKS